MKVEFKHTGDFSKTQEFLLKLINKEYLIKLSEYGRQGVEALAAVTPKRTGLTAASWTYEISDDGRNTTIQWKNTNIQNGINIAVILDYGHGTGRGTYVQGRHYISPAIQPVFDKIAEECWKEITSV
jgi:hypothetical protein